MNNALNTQKKLFALISVFLISLLFSIGAGAEGVSLPSEYGDWVDALPEEIRKILPEELLSKEGETIEKSVETWSTPTFWIERIWEELSGKRNEFLGAVGGIGGLLLLGALCRLFVRREGENDWVVNLCLCLALALFTVQNTLPILKLSAAYLETLHKTASAFLPLMTSLYVLGGNPFGAVANQTAFSFFLWLCETVVGKTLMPFAGVCLGLSLAGCTVDELRVGCITGRLRGLYAKGIGLLSMLFCAVLGLQNQFAAAKDTLAMKTVRFTVNSSIPYLGSAIGEGLKLSVSGVKYLRTLFGTGLMAALLLPFLPLLVSLVGWQLALGAGSALADLLGCDSERKMLGELEHFFGCLLAVLSFTAVTFLFSLAVMMRTAAGAGG